MQNDATLMHLWFMISFEAGKIYSNLFDQAKKNAPAYSIIASNGYIIYFYVCVHTHNTAFSFPF